MTRHFDAELKDLKSGLVAMAGQVEEMIDLAMAAMVRRSDALAEHVMELDRRVDEMEIALDRACIDLLGLRAPFATDLRLLASSLKIVPQLERIGDHCKNIGRRALILNRQTQVLNPDYFQRMGGAVRGMVRDAVDAFLNGDAALARSVIAADDTVDELHLKIFGELLRLMIQDPLCIERASHLIIVNKNFERIADHATNIAEEVLFILEGVNVKHPYLRQEHLD
ncbi:MAG: phosphate signaling complex protein PhoU [Acidobacteria bacterium]|nr:phosphate signaling complex protein PhoU [Acidobacteriota bacterium]